MKLTFLLNRRVKFNLRTKKNDIALPKPNQYLKIQVTLI